MDAWILFTLFAAVMQTVRTAAQKKLSKDLSPMTTTFVRYLYGVPFVFIYLAFVKDDIALTDAFGAPRISSFIIYASLAGAAQIVATYWLIKVLQLRNFAIGTIFAKTEALQTALLGIVFFSAFLSMAGWFAIILGVIGITAISYPDHQQSIDWQSVKYGTLSGLGFGFCALWLREASLSLDFSYIQNAALTLSFTVPLQTAACLLFILLKERAQLSYLKDNLSISLFIGATSAMGSVGWYTAMTYQDAALVRALGQIELVFALLVSYFFFKEKLSFKEAAGLLLIACSILILLFAV